MEARNIDGLPPTPLNNDQWLEWEEAVLKHRIRVQEETSEPWSGQEQARSTEILRVHKDGRYWLSTYGSIYQARPEESLMSLDLDDDWDSEDESNGWVTPFIPYVFQLYYWDFQHRAFRTKGPKGDVAIVKSRQMGMSYMACALFAHLWMTKKPFQGRLLSRKEDLVDEVNNPDSLFWKIRMMLESQPSWLLSAFAPGFSWKDHSLNASLTNPDNYNHLAGESTNATAGRGGAATAILLDEFAFMRGMMGIWTATRAATKHRIAISTVNLKLGSGFHDLVTQEDGEGPAVLHIPYYLHPHHDQEWFENERKRDTRAGFEVEVMMNWFGDESDFVYPFLGQKKVGDFPYIPYAGPVFVAIDDGWSGYWAFHVIQYIEETGRHRIIDSYRNKQRPVDFYGGLFRGMYIDGYDYGEDEHAIISLFKTIENPVYVGDTHGRHVEQVAGMSVIERLASQWNIYVNVDYEKRDYKDRKEFTDRILPYIDWNDTPRTRRALMSCRTYKWKPLDDSAEVMTEYREPIKNHNSHDPTALEYYATNFEQFRNIYSVGGKIVYE